MKALFVLGVTDIYATKGIEYLVCIGFLLLLAPFWLFLSRPAQAAGRIARDALRRGVDEMVEWFRVPSQVHFHPGHAWARGGEADLVTVGMDDFAHKMVGPLSSIRLPAIGTRLGQGEKGWALCADSKWIDMLSPIDGTVVAVNEQRMGNPGGEYDPYGDGWLVQVKPSRRAANEKNLLHGALACRWMENACAQLRGQMDPALGQVYQDGGVPVSGMARSLDPEHWDELIRQFFLT